MLIAQSVHYNIGRPYEIPFNFFQIQFDLFRKFHVLIFLKCVLQGKHILSSELVNHVVDE